MFSNNSTPKELVEYFMNKKAIRYKKGETVVRLGDIPLGAYYIEKGFVKVYSLTETGEENLNFIYRPGEIFPLAWAFNNRDPRAYYEAFTEVILRRTTKESFFAFLDESKYAQTYLIKYLTDKVDGTFERVHQLELTNSYPRIIAFIIYLAKHFGYEKNGEIVFDMPLTQKDIANSINMTRETASKELNKLAKKKILKCSGRSKLIIYNLVKLEKELLLHYERKSL